MYKNPIFIFFLIATFIIFQPFILSPENAFRDNRGFLWAINFLFSTFWFNYIPVLILIFIKFLKEIFKHQVLQKTLKILNIIVIIVTVIFYIFEEFIIIGVSYAFEHW